MINKIRKRIKWYYHNKPYLKMFEYFVIGIFIFTVLFSLVRIFTL